MKSAKFPASFKSCGGFYLISRLATKPNRNFCLFVAKKGKAYFHLNADFHNMVTGKELTAGYVEQTMPLPSDGNIMRIAGHKAGVSVRIIAKLCGMIEAQVPIGYEDEGGFHYGADTADWFFSI